VTNSLNQSGDQYCEKPAIVAIQSPLPANSERVELKSPIVLLAMSSKYMTAAAAQIVTATATATAVLMLLASPAVAQTPPTTPSEKTQEQQAKSDVTTITVEAQRESLKRQVRTFVSAIAAQRFGDSLARWEKPTVICPQIAGLPRADGEFILARLSRLARSAGAPLGPERCKANFFVIVTEKPNALLKALEKKHPEMYTNGYYTLIRQFESATSPIRVWYNAELYDEDGRRHAGNASGTASNIKFSTMRDLTSVIVIVDTQRVRESGVTFGQIAAYIAMVGLAELRSDPKIGAAPTILSVFSTSGAERPPGLTVWDQAYLKALYHTSHWDRMQLAEIKTSVVNEVAP
jgi:hypothetical protein